MNLDDLVTRGATAADAGDVLRRFQGVEVFFPLQDDVNVLGPVPSEAMAGIRIKLQTANLEAGKMALFYVSRDDARLGDRFAGIPLALAARAVCNERGMDGLLLQGSSDAWICFSKQKLLEVIGQLRDQVVYKNFE